MPGLSVARSVPWSPDRAGRARPARARRAGSSRARRASRRADAAAETLPVSELWGGGDGGTEGGAAPHALQRAGSGRGAVAVGHRGFGDLADPSEGEPSHRGRDGARARLALGGPVGSRSRAMVAVAPSGAWWRADAGSAHRATACWSLRVRHRPSSATRVRGSVARLMGIERECCSIRGPPALGVETPQWSAESIRGHRARCRKERFDDRYDWT
jgi:hypothetical protein